MLLLMAKLPYSPPVHIPFNIYIQSPGSMVRFFMVTVIIRRTFNCIDSVAFTYILFIYYFIGHICMVHIHKGPVRVCGKLLLPGFQFHWGPEPSHVYFLPVLHPSPWHCWVSLTHAHNKLSTTTLESGIVNVTS